MKKILLFLLLSLGLISLTSAENFDTDILKLKATNSCVMCNLNGVDLAGANLNYTNLTETDLSGANLSCIIFVKSEVKFVHREKNLSCTTFRGANLSGADLTGADLTGADLSYANLSGANLSYADLTGADLTGADLTGADLSYTNLNETDFSGATLCNTETPWGIDYSGC